jgi:hypothetical protein
LTKEIEHLKESLQRTHATPSSLTPPAETITLSEQQALGNFDLHHLAGTLPLSSEEQAFQLANLALGSSQVNGLFRE